MNRRHILEALRDGGVGLEEARRAVLAKEPPVGVKAEAGAATLPSDPEALDRLQGELVKSLAEALYAPEDEITRDANFKDLGLDSIVGVEWINQIKKHYGVKVPATKVYDYPTIEAFSVYLQGVIKETAPRVQAKTPAPVARAGQVARVETRERVRPPVGSIAIVGMSGRYPGAPNLGRFWENLAQGKNAIREIPRERWNADDYYDADPSKPGKIYSKWLGALDDIDRFDAPFFMISPAEAEVMDPQYRIFLETAYSAFEDAGYGAQSLSGRKCGVYMGVMNSEYVHLLSPEQAQGLNTGNNHSIAAARVSYFLNLKGPAIPIDTACSSSLVATHLACQALRNGEIDMALVGGVTLYLTPASFIGMCAAGMLSADGQCKSFDNAANGFVPGEGAGALVLKRLEDAERDHDRIHGVIVGSGINQDGRTNGITAPSVQSQIELERDVYDRFNVDPATIDYVEAHGTGTKLGDPVELEALTTVFRERTKRRNFCAIGSVKSNIGHTSAAAGMAGIHKMLLCFKHRTLVPTLNFKEANTHCDFEDSPFYVNTETKPWTARADAPRRAAVSSMGFSGTNAHVVIEEYAGPARTEENGTYGTKGTDGVVVVVSAKNEARLMDAVRRLHGFLKAGGGRPALCDLAYTLQVGRDAMEERLALVVESLDDLEAKLAAILDGREVAECWRGRVPRVKGKLALIEADAALTKVLDGWVAEGRWAKLAERWVGGLVVEWARFYREDRPYRVSLPTYPFARERHWVTTEGPADGRPATLIPPPAKAVARTAAAEPERVVAQPLAKPLEKPRAAGRETVLAKPTGVALGAPAAVRAKVEAGTPAGARPRVTLNALSTTAEPSVVRAAEKTERVLKAKDVLDDLKSAVGAAGNMVPTLNRTGVMLEKLTATSRAFATYAGTCGGEVLDIGCAYGVATIAALENGATVMAVDMEPRHLEILEARVAEGVKTRLRTRSGMLPAVDFEAGRFAAIHAARVIHFLRPEDVRTTIRKMFDWLQPGGCVFLISDTPYVGYWKTKADDYEARKTRGDLWPGYIDDVARHFGRRDTDGAPPLINALDPDVLRRECEAAGFAVEQVGFEGGEVDIGLDGTRAPGREHAAIVARKPVGAIAAKANVAAPTGAHADAEAQAGEIQRYLKRSLADALHTKIEAIDEDTPFIELGVDSVISVTWVRGINTEYGLSIGATRIYDYPSVRQFAEFLRDECAKVGKTPVSPKVVTKATETKRAEAREVARPYGLVLSKAHTFAEIGFERWDVAPPAATEVTVQVKASAVSFTDTICVKGLYPAAYPFVPGLEVAGVITRVGAEAGDLRVGDEVIALTSGRMGGHAEQVNVPATHAVRKPRALSFEDACSLPLAFGTTYYALEMLGRLAPGEHVLVQTATGGCGLMALQLARLKGCVCHGTSSRAEKREFLRRIGVMNTLDYGAPGFERTLREQTNGQGVDVVLNTLSGEAIQHGLNALAPSGRYLELATHALLTSRKLDLSNLRFNQSIQTVAFLEVLSRADGSVVRELLERMVAWVEAGKITPTVSRVYPLGRTAEALEYVSEARHIGKVVISHTAETMDDRMAELVTRLDAQRRVAEMTKTSETRAVTPKKPTVEKIAIIGMSGRFPKARTLAEFWKNLATGRDCVSEIPAERWSVEQFYDPNPAAPGKTCCKWMGALEDIDRFDPLFFQISPAEARMMDPQQRLFIESCWSCLEDAGMNPRSLSGTNCGVFAGCGIGDYGLTTERGGVIGATGVAPSILPARVSYLLNLKGPCLAIDTSCSSSLVAIANACDSLILGNCDLAMAGGVLVMTGPSLHVGMSQGGMLSPDGRCFTFDERANGFVPGEGVGVVLLKRLSDALRDGDPIHGVIQGWAVNQDGKTNGITAPSRNSQAALERDLYARCGVNPETITLAEAHGTGTRLGDPIEVEALTEAFRAFTQKRAYCALGSVKSNIGHLGVAAGVAGVLKVLLALRHRTIPPTVHFEKLNPHIPLEGSPFYIGTQARSWDVPAGQPRRATVSSFGFSGTNAHLVIEEPPAMAGERTRITGPAIVVLSAKTTEALAEAARRLREFLVGEPAGRGCELHDLAYTLQVGREGMQERVGWVVGTREELVDKLGAFIDGGNDAGTCRGRMKEGRDAVVAFVAEDKTNGVMERWIREQRHAEILAMWAKGLELDWNRLYPRGKPRRVSVPSYPFARERYWLDDVKPEMDVFMARPVWKAVALSGATAGAAAGAGRHLVLVSDVARGALDAIRRTLPNAECAVLVSGRADVAGRFSDDVLRVLAVLKDTLAGMPADGAWVQVAHLGEGDDALTAGLSGLLKTARLENPRLRAQLVECDAVENVAESLAQATAMVKSGHLRFAAGQMWVPVMEEIVSDAARATSPWKDDGVYLITGGAGGLGLVFAREIVARTKRAKVMLAGRSELNAERAAELKTLARTGATVGYHRVDVAKADEVDAWVDTVRGQYGKIDGVLHAAGVIRDGFILKKDANACAEVLGPKVAGAVNLDRATRGLVLDFFVLFSSGAGVTGNAGQADYAAANAFLDALARQRAVRAEQHGGETTLSINWPLWKDGGMRVSETTERAARETTGMVAMDTATGLRAFYRALAAGGPQVMVIAGDVARIRKGFTQAEARTALDADASVAVRGGDLRVREKALRQLKQVLGGIVDLAPDRIEADEPLERYGIDSLMVTRMNEQLGRAFPEVSQTLFFEFKTLADVAAHLAEVFPSETRRWTRMDERAETLVERKSMTEIEARMPAVAEETRATRLGNAGVQEPIAIIGICGRYARAETLEAFWKNLASGLDCVTEIPAERWAMDGFFHANPDEAIKLGRSYSKWGSFLDGFAEFDPLFFNISPLEALGMDPQERLFLQASWEVLEAAGYTRARLEETVDRDVGVFAGVTKTGFEHYRADWRRQGEVVTPYTSFGSIANRVSYVLNLKGPSMPIDTMCSSSLTAIHEACEQLRRGGCRMAIAGGVNLYLHPSSYVGLCAQRMLSRDGKCKSFGAGGDGFVPGEGVGVVLLKPLSQARADGDPIHAIIRGTSVNHGGKTNGYTVPNPQAQRDVIRAALAKSGVDARHVSYLEAHGTGTELGDPIEVTGLTQAFATEGARVSKATGYCALGSAKSNLGHLEAAAGIAGLTKVVLQMRHGKLAPSLHATTLNPKIAFEKTPFVVQRELAEWPRVEGRPRIAGVSSFGAGGANAHVVLEEPPASARGKRRDGAALIVLSAKTDERLKAYAKKLSEALDEADDLHEIAFTLQTGREAMSERLALVAGSVAELREKLEAWMGEPVRADGVLCGCVQRGGEGAGFFADEDMAETIATWMRKGKLARIAEVWVRGGVVKWEQLYASGAPRRIVLPTYPFARETYWVAVREETATGNGRLHPLVHENRSDVMGLKFETTLTGAESVVADHVVNGAKVLPGVAYLEMARFAAREVSGAKDGGRGAVIRNLAWVRPLVVDGGGTRVEIRLADAGEDGLAFSVAATEGDGAGEPVVCSQGFVRAGHGVEAPVLSLERLRAEISARRMTREACYAAFAEKGVSYGPSYQGIQEVFVGAGQVLARIALPERLGAVGSEWVVEPGMMDSALQACIGLALDGAGDEGHGGAAVPYALDEAAIFGTCAGKAWAWIRPSSIASKVDIDLCDEGGRVSVALRGLSFRRLDGALSRGGESEPVLMTPEWTTAEVLDGAKGPAHAERRVLLCGVDAVLPGGVECVRLRTEGVGMAERYECAAAHAFEVIRAMLKTPGRGKRLVQIVVPAEGDGGMFAGLAGLVKTARIENPELIGQVIAVDAGETGARLMRVLEDNGRCPDDVQVRYEAGRRQVISWRDVARGAERATAPWKDGGVYLITGGAGGLGMIFAGAIARQTRGATVILCGRSALSAEKRGELRALESNGATIVYRQADVRREGGVETLVGEIRNAYGALDGVLHGAGVIRDRLIVNKTTEEFRDVLAAKVAGALNLDVATQGIALDFFAVFAAGAGVLGNAGQADYAAANAFLDAFARRRNKQVRAGERRGRTIAVDWPLWAGGGMEMHADAVAAMREKTGMTPLGAEAGVAAFARAVASGHDQILVANGDPQRLRAMFAARREQAQAAEVDHGSSVRAMADESLETRTIAYFRELISTTLRVPLQRIPEDGLMSDLGIDSVVVMSLTVKLEESFGALSKTLFFEHQTVRALARYFVETHGGKLAQVLRPAVTVAPVRVPMRVTPTEPVRRASEPVDAKPTGALDIAIIGVSGRYPQARNIAEFWTVLSEGWDCITEVPKERWDWREYYSEDGAQPKGHASKWGGFIDDVDKFDPQFFNISPKIAPYLDPQERLVLEEAWRALEDAGYRREDLQTRAGDESWSPVGVYIGAMYGEYQLLGAEAAAGGQRLGFAGNLASLANRISYVLNLHGPSMMVDTMCSSSLTCIHLACQDLAAGRTNCALAGGVNVTIHPNKYLMLSGGQFLSASGRCESFGEGGAGYIPSEGVGVVVLKRLADAERDGDHIYGVIKGSAVNHGGRTHGYSVPNPKAQERVIAQALAEARVDARAVSYIEAHGTGTKLGDPIEIAALAKAFERRPRDLRCWIGSAKSNIGHCESAAGVAGLTKVLLQMRHGQIAPSLHSRVLNPHIDFEATPFAVNQTLREWRPPVVDGKRAPRIAGLSSFGAGGSNAHLVIEEYAPKPAERTTRNDGALAQRAVIVLSAKNAERLMDVVRALRDHVKPLDAETPGTLRDLAYTLQVGREAMEERMAFEAGSLAEMRETLNAILAGRGDVAGVVRGRVEDATGARGAGMGAGDVPRRWVCGETIEWRRLYGDERPRRVSLPGYPFARKRFWVDVPKAQPVERTVTPTLVPLEKPRGVALTPLMAVATTPKETRLDLPEELNEAPEPATAKAPALSPVVDPPKPVADAVSTKVLQDALRTSLAQALFLEEHEIGLDKPFLEMGLDSIVGVEWVNGINKTHGLTIPANQVYEYPSLRKFTEFLQAQLVKRAVDVPPPVVVDAPAPVAAPLAMTMKTDAEPKRVERTVTAAEAGKTTDIAIVGMAGRFPGGETLEEFWRLLKAGGTALGELPKDRGWDLADMNKDGSPMRKIAEIRGAFLKNVDRFDPLFFQISPKEAATMDPGERLFLEESWKAIEDAGVVPAEIAGQRWGVFCGNGGDYSLRIRDAVGFSPHVTLAQVPSRVSHCLNLTGPSQSVDAGCASALLAIAQACDNLVLGKCEVALAGGVLVHSTPNLIVSAAQVDLLAKGEAAGRALDGGAGGMTPSEAVAVVVLKPLADALAAGDRIHGVIEGWGNNHNGKTNGITAPSADVQMALFSEVYERFGIDPTCIQFVEANASGLPLADAAEVRALSQVFREKGVAAGTCALGTVENNVGHAFHASGMAHVMKVLLGLRHREIPGTVNVARPIADVAREESPFFVHAQTVPWRAQAAARRRAAISSFGATGANVHLVIAEAPGRGTGEPALETVDARKANEPVLVVLSAKTEAGLKQRCRDLADAVQAGGVSLRALAANLVLRRSHFEHRCALVAADGDVLSERLRELAEGRRGPDSWTGVVETGMAPRPALALLAEAQVATLATGGKLTRETLLVLADLFVQGAPLKMAECFSEAEKAPLSLPAYAFERRRCWIDAGPTTAGAERETTEPVDTTLAVLMSFVAELTALEVAEIDARLPLSHYGIDSLIGMRFLNRLNERFGGGFDASLLVLHSIRGVAEEIARKAGGARNVKGETSPAGALIARWARPAFIETVAMPVGVGTDDGGTGEAQLARLMANGVGVWKEAGELRFEFYARTQTRETIGRLVENPGALAAALEGGKRYFPASEMQRFALHESEVLGRTTFNLCQAFWIDGPVDRRALTEAFGDLVGTHAVFRTGARLVGAEWTQVVCEELAVECGEIVWPEARTEADFKARLAVFQRERGAERINVGRPSLLDLWWAHNGDALGAVVFRAHHFHADGFTLYLFLQELHERYLAKVRGEVYAAPRARAEYAHFALAQFAPGRADEGRYWAEKVSGKGGRWTLRDRAEHVDANDRKTGFHELAVSAEMLAQWSEFNRKNRATFTQGVTSALAVLLYRATGVSHPIQMVINLRDRAEFEGTRGDFSASLPFFLEVDGRGSWAEVLRAYETAAIELQRHKHVDFSALLQAGGLPGDVALDSNDRDAFGEVTGFAKRLIDFAVEDRAPVVPLLVCVVKTGGKMTVPIIYDRSRFSKTTIELIAESLLGLTRQLLQRAETPIREVEISGELAQRLEPVSTFPEKLPSHPAS